MTTSSQRKVDLSGLKWNQWRSVCNGRCQLTPTLTLEVFISFVYENPFDAFTPVPQARADEAFDKAAKMIEWVVENERTVYSTAAEKDIPDLLNRSRSKKTKRKPNSVSTASLNPEWKALFIRHAADCPIELQYEFDLGMMTTLDGNDLVIIVGSDFQYREVKLRGGA